MLNYIPKFTGYEIGFAHGMLLATSQEYYHNEKNNINFTKNDVPLILLSQSTYIKEISNLIDEVNEYYDLPAGWDNETEEKTNPVCLDHAKNFINLLSIEYRVPKFSAATGEEVALYWEYDNFYLIIYFMKNGNLRFYVNDNGEEVDGNIVPLNNKIPDIIANYLLIK